MKVRTTIQPWLELDVDEREYADLKAQGLLLQDPLRPGRLSADTDREN